jgi:hypothetical protein
MAQMAAVLKISTMIPPTVRSARAAPEGAMSQVAHDTNAMTSQRPRTNDQATMMSRRYIGEIRGSDGGIVFLSLIVAPGCSRSTLLPEKKLVWLAVSSQDCCFLPSFSELFDRMLGKPELWSWTS